MVPPVFGKFACEVKTQLYRLASSYSGFMNDEVLPRYRDSDSRCKHFIERHFRHM